MKYTILFDANGYRVIRYLISGVIAVCSYDGRYYGTFPSVQAAREKAVELARAI